MSKDLIELALIDTCERRCVDYGDDYKEMCAKIAASVCRYPVVDEPETTFYMGGTPVGANAPKETVPVQFDESVLEKTTATDEPKFPMWVLAGTSIDRGLECSRR